MAFRKTLPFFFSYLILITLLCFGAQAYASGLDANKSFTPATVLPKEVSRLVVELQNSNTVVATNTAFTDVFPAGVFVAATPNATTTCGTGTVTHSNGATEGQLTLSGGTVPAGDGVNPGKCKIEIDVIAPTKGTYINTIAAGDVTATVSGSGISTAQATSATLTALINPFTVRITSDTNSSTTSSSVYLKGEDVATMTLTLTNPNAVSLTNVNMDWDFSTLSAGYYARLLDGTGGGTCGGTVSVTDAGGSSTTYREETDFDYTGGTIPANGSCTITVQLQTRAYADQSYRNYGYGNAAVAPNTFSTAEGATNNSTAGYFYAFWGIDVEKTFDDETLKQVHAISGAATSQLKLVFENLQVVPVTLNIADIMPTSPGQMTVDSIDSNTCGGTISTNGGTEINLAGGSLPASPRVGSSSTFSSCEILATVSVLADGTYTNDIPSGTTGGYTYGSTAASLIKTSGAATIKKERQNEGIHTGDENVYIYTISNLSDPTIGDDILNLRLRDNFEVKKSTTNYGTLLTVSQANVMSSTCAGTVFNSTPGDEFFDISGVTVPKGTSCQIKVQVSHKANDEDYAYQAFENIAVKTNIADATEEGVVFDTGTSTDNIFGAEVLLQHSQWNSFYMDMDFIPTAVNVGGIARLRYEIQSDMYTNQAISNLAFKNTLPTDLTVAANPNFSSTCGGTLNAVPGSNYVEFSGGYMTGNVLTAPISTSSPSRYCWVEVDIQAPPVAGSYSTSIPGENKLTSFTDLDATGEKVGEIAPYKYFYKNYSDTATLTVNPVDIGVNKAFLTPVIGGGEPSRVRITIANNTTGAPPLTGVSVTDAFTGSDMYLYSNIDATFTDTSGSDSDGCRNATITGNPGDGSITLSNADIDGGEICRFEFNVTSDVGGNHINSIGVGEVTSDQGITNPTAVSATLTVERELNLSKGFTPSHVGPGETSVLTIEITNSNQAPADYTGAAVALIDEMPAGLAIQSIVSNTCGGTATIGTQNGNDTVELSGGNFNAESACRIEANVSASSTGAYTNTLAIGSLQTNEGATNGSQGEATLSVNEPPTINKSFYPSTIGPGMTSRITFRVYNNADVALTGISFTDTMSNMNLTSPMVIGGTCQSVTYNATAGGNVFEVTGGVVPANSDCTITTTVTSSVVGAHDNTTSGADSDQTGTGPVSNTSTLNVQELPVLSKSFTPSVIQVGTVSTLTFTLTNNNDASVRMESWPHAFQDFFPNGMTVAATPNVTMTCSSGALRNDANDAAPVAGDIGVTFDYGFVPANGSCTASVDVTVANPGSYVNTTTAAKTEYLGYIPAATATLTATAGAPPSYDYGDAPTAGTAPSGTGSNNYGEARHQVVAGLHLGAVAPDNDASYQSSLNADGDDTDGTDDDDGISTLPSLSAADSSYTIPATNITATGDGTLHAWVDFNGDGSFTSDEHTSVTVTAGTLSGALSWTGLTGLVAGDSFIRLRLTTDSLVTASAPSIPASDGEVEDYPLTIQPPPTDYSDGPTSGVAYGDAKHIIVAGIQLGATIDDDTTIAGGIASANADGDDTTGIDDDDGVTIPVLKQGFAATVTVDVNQIAANDGYLQGWIDWNGNGVYEATEQVASNLQFAGGTAGTISVPVTVPATATTAQTFARFRWSTTADLTSTAAANDGEVEDYALTVIALDYSDAPVDGSPAPDGSSVTSYGIAGHDVNAYDSKLGSTITTESGAVQDADNVSDDGVTFPALFRGQSATISVAYNYTGTGSGTLSGWVDWNGDGDFADAGETIASLVADGQTGVDTNPASNIIDLTVNVPTNAIVGPQTWARFRFSDDPVAGSTGFVQDGEVEDYTINILKLEDYSDAPADGSTAPDGASTTSYGVASHDLQSFDSKLGSLITNESAAVLNADNVSDDGVSFTSLILGLNATISTSYTYTGTGTGTLHGWIDWNGDGDFADAGEYVANSVTDGQVGVDQNPTANIIDLSVPVPASAITTAPTWARFRFSDDTVTGATGSMSNGEVEDYLITISSGKEYGDAPDSYGTLDASGGAAHVVVSSTLYLGAGMPDVESDGVPGATADGDDTNGADDEDGVATLPALTPGDSNYRITVAATNTTALPGRLIAWLDFDRNGTFEADEAAARVVPAGTTAGSFVVAWASIPADIQQGTTYLRLRYTTDAMNAGDPKGEKSNGEVEDYVLSIGAAGATLTGRVYIDANSNATEDVGEAGIGGTVVALFDAATGTCRSTTTNANGDYTFLDLADGSYEVFQAHGETTPVPQNCLIASINNPPGYQSTTPDTLMFAVTGADVTDQDFGEVAGTNSTTSGNTGVGIAFEPDHQSEVLPGNVAFYAHVFSSEAKGWVKFTTADSGNIATGWTHTLYHDSDCSGTLNGVEANTVINGINYPVDPENLSNPVDGVSRICIIDKVYTPANVPAQDRYEVKTTATFTFAGATVDPATLQVTDLTIAGQKVTPTTSAAPAAVEVGESRLVLRKTVENQTQGTAETATLNQAKPGDFLKYRIYYRNTGTGPITDLKVNDSVPPYTGFVTSSESCDVTPAGMTCTPAINIDQLNWGFTGSLIGGASGNVSYEVMVDN